MSDGRYQNIVDALFGHAWAIQAEKLQAIVDVVRLRVEGIRLDADEIQARIGNRQAPTKQAPGSVAVLPLFGVMAHRMNLMTEISGGTSTEIFGLEFDAAAADSSVKAIVIDVDSPGGSVHGLQELSDKVFNARKPGRPIVAVANDLAASAAYWVGTSADELVVTPGGLVGSIGVVAVHTDVSKANEEAGITDTIVQAGENKAEFSSLRPLADSAKAELQRSIDQYYAQFVADVARNRGVGTAEVLEKFGKGRVFQGPEAVQRGMADRVATMETVLAGFGVHIRSDGSMAPMPVAYKPHAWVDGAAPKNPV